MEPMIVVGLRKWLGVGVRICFSGSVCVGGGWISAREGGCALFEDLRLVNGFDKQDSYFVGDSLPGIILDVETR